MNGVILSRSIFKLIKAIFVFIILFLSLLCPSPFRFLVTMLTVAFLFVKILLFFDDLLWSICIIIKSVFTLLIILLLKILIVVLTLNRIINVILWPLCIHNLFFKSFLLIIYPFHLFFHNMRLGLTLNIRCLSVLYLILIVLLLLISNSIIIMKLFFILRILLLLVETPSPVIIFFLLVGIIRMFWMVLIVFYCFFSFYNFLDLLLHLFNPLVVVWRLFIYNHFFFLNVFLFRNNFWIFLNLLLLTLESLSPVISPLIAVSVCQFLLFISLLSKGHGQSHL